MRGVKLPDEGQLEDHLVLEGMEASEGELVSPERRARRMWRRAVELGADPWDLEAFLQVSAAVVRKRAAAEGSPEREAAERSRLKAIGRLSEQTVLVLRAHRDEIVYASAG